MPQYKAATPPLRPALHLAALPAALLLAACATGRPAPSTTAPVADAVPAGTMAETPVTSPVTSPVAATTTLPPATPLNSLDEASASSPALRDNAPLRYVVKPGDTLWAIASRFLADPWQWPEVWYVNGKVANPHRIYPGDVLELYNVRGRTVLARTDDLVAQGDLERVSPQVRAYPLGSNLPAIPIDAIRAFLNGPRAVDLETLEAAPYILAFAESRLLGAEQAEVFLKRLAEGTDTVFATVRKGEAYRDPDTGELLGYEALPSGEVEVRRFGNPAAGEMTRSVREVLAGDRLLPLEANNFAANFYPHAPARSVGGRIISVYEGVTQIGQYQIVALNRGTKHGLEVGHVLDIEQASRKVRDPVTGKNELLPRQKAGLLMVFKTMPGISYGLVMTATRAIHVLDHVEKPDPSAP